MLGLCVLCLMGGVGSGHGGVRGCCVALGQGHGEEEEEGGKLSGEEEVGWDWLEDTGDGADCGLMTTARTRLEIDNMVEWACLVLVRPPHSFIALLLTAYVLGHFALPSQHWPLQSFLIKPRERFEAHRCEHCLSV